MKITDGNSASKDSQDNRSVENFSLFGFILLLADVFIAFFIYEEIRTISYEPLIYLVPLVSMAIGYFSASALWGKNRQLAKSLLFCFSSLALFVFPIPIIPFLNMMSGDHTQFIMAFAVNGLILPVLYLLHKVNGIGNK